MPPYKCGRHYHERTKKNKQVINDLATEGYYYSHKNINPVKMDLYSGYLGKVPVCVNIENNKIYLETIYTSSQNRKILIKIIDITENNLSDSYVYPVEHLTRLNAVCIDKDENVYKYVVTVLCYLRINELEHVQDNIDKYKKLYEEAVTPVIKTRITKEHPELVNDTKMMSPSYYKRVLQQSLEYNSRVDIMFAVLEYLEFISKMTNGHIDTINNQDILICLSGVPKLDNAYWNGSYMIFGNGDSIFYPLASLDVIGHELTHGLVQGICDLEYRGHSGALNESYADIFGTMLEFYVYDKYSNKLLQKSDWCIGEDLAINKSCLRNMQDPHSCEQPAKMYDQYYVDPNSMIDYGGVHINSGIPNHCFYLTSQSVDKYEALKMFINCLYKLFRQSNFFGFSETLSKLSNNKSINTSLSQVGLAGPGTVPGPTRPSPIPVPVPSPSPYPSPKPIPVPSPIPSPVPRPSPYPIPVPRPVPSPSPYPFPSPYPSPSQYPYPYPRYPTQNSFAQYTLDPMFTSSYLQYVNDYNAYLEYYARVHLSDENKPDETVNSN